MKVYIDPHPNHAPYGIQRVVEAMRRYLPELFCFIDCLISLRQMELVIFTRPSARQDLLDKYIIGLVNLSRVAIRASWNNVSGRCVSAKRQRILMLSVKFFGYSVAIVATVIMFLLYLFPLLLGKSIDVIGFQEKVFRFIMVYLSGILFAIGAIVGVKLLPILVGILYVIDGSLLFAPLISFTLVGVVCFSVISSSFSFSGGVFLPKLRGLLFLVYPSGATITDWPFGSKLPVTITNGAVDNILFRLEITITTLAKSFCTMIPFSVASWADNNSLLFRHAFTRIQNKVQALFCTRPLSFQAFRVWALPGRVQGRINRIWKDRILWKHLLGSFHVRASLRVTQWRHSWLSLRLPSLYDMTVLYEESVK